MKYIVLALAFIICPLNVHATEVKFSSFSIDIPDNYQHIKTNTALEIFDADKKNVLLVLVLPETKKELDEYSAAIISDYKGRDIAFDEEAQSHSFTFEDADFGECIGITKELKDKYLFISIGGNNKDILLELANTLK